MKIFKNGKFTDDYDGPENADEIVKFMLNKASMVSKELKSQADIEHFFEGNNEHIIVGFFKSLDSILLSEFQSVAYQMGENIKFAHSVNSEINAKYGHEEDIVIFQPLRLHSKLEPNKISFKESKIAFKIKDFIQNELHGIVGMHIFII